MLFVGTFTRDTRLNFDINIRMVFMRFGTKQIRPFWLHFLILSSIAWRVQPRNYLLFACHFTNAAAQSIQDVRFVNYWHRGGREQRLALTTKGEEEGPKQVVGAVTQAIISANEAKKEN
jgi:hypothetical protein